METTQEQRDKWREDPFHWFHHEHGGPAMVKELCNDVDRLEREHEQLRGGIRKLADSLESDAARKVRALLGEKR